MEASAMLNSDVFWAYVDPVAVLPVTSILATAVGVGVLCGKTVLQFVARWARLTMRNWVASAVPSGAHFPANSTKL
jgi:hypothetical protein